MPKEAHLSIRVPQLQKRELERLAAEQDIPVGQLVRRALLQLVESPGSVQASPHSRATVSLRPGQRVSRDAEMDWLEAHIPELTSSIPGQWIILDGTQLIAHGEDYLAVLKEARQKGVVVPFVARIPEGPVAGRLMGL
jgi:hypothetical protein